MARRRWVSEYEVQATKAEKRPKTDPAAKLRRVLKAVLTVPPKEETPDMDPPHWSQSAASYLKFGAWELDPEKLAFDPGYKGLELGAAGARVLGQLIPGKAQIGQMLEPQFAQLLGSLRQGMQSVNGPQLGSPEMLELLKSRIRDEADQGSRELLPRQLGKVF